MNPNKLKVLSNQFIGLSLKQTRCYSTHHHKRSKTHYEALGIQPKSSQAQVKSAYYRLSQVYHPDKNKGDHAREKFHEITAAYEVLGNESSRSHYDKGLASGIHHHRPPTMPTQSNSHVDKEFRQAGRRIHVGRTKAFDYDEHIKQHYGNLRHRQRKETDENLRRQQNYEKHAKQTDTDTAYVIVLCVLAVIFFGRISVG